ncbi:sensor histidine kinase [Desulfurobacterium atlanticum]|uniref:histidine kinase n=1 Tax=Desulfurobacterium atlanticum TaxID=240169 RepID=A0A238XQF7_9BACT|nr:ATP-binding protein [Desulfurobacterium atlanticum]SNR61205.1 two-component system, OmpR family, phosphate regulon sensor histidine kinase PhoR [Desulfurobacterium atlanticum]
MVISSVISIFLLGVSGYLYYKVREAERVKTSLKNLLSLHTDLSWSEILRVIDKELKERQYKDNIHLLSQALNLLNEGLVIMTPAGKVIYTNRFARELLDIDKESYKGKYFYQAISDLDVISFINENFHKDYNVWESKKIKNRYVQLVFASDINEKVLLLRDLTQIKKYENLKKDFIANVSHELKTPVATLKVLMETLEDECDENETAKEFIKKAQDRIKYMEQLIQDLITLTMLETSKGILFENKSINLSNLLSRIVEETSVIAKRKNVTVVLDVPEKLEVKGDERLFYFIFKNLIDNAIKYNHEGGKVEIKYSTLPKEQVISVCDTGPGIPKSHLPFIFERFYRVDKSRSRKLGGTGLGLSIVKLAVEKLNGKVDVESEVGKGTCFKVYLPYT